MLYSIIVPVYRSEQTLELLATRVKSVFEELNADYEIVFVEDCGGGKSWEVLKEVRNLYPHHTTIIKLSKNSGQHNAIMCGLNHVKGDYIITIDDDLQCPPEEIPKLIAQLQLTNTDLVYGMYGEKKHHFLRNLGSWWVWKLFESVFKADPRITSFRIIRRNLVAKLIEHKQPFVFIDGLLHWHTNNISRIVVNHQNREYGASTYTIAKLISLTSNLFFNFTVIPLRAVTYFGVLVAMMSFILGIYFLFHKLYYDVPMGYTSLIVTMLFSTGTILISLGIIGEYLSRIYMLQNHKPQYSIEQLNSKESL